MLSVSSAFNWPALGMPTRIPHCCWTPGSDSVGSIRPSSKGRPAYSSNFGKMVDTATVSVGNVSGAPARIAPVAGATGLPSAVTSAVQVPL